MRRISFALALMGLFFLVLMLYGRPEQGSLDGKQINDKVVVSGVLNSVRNGKSLSFFKIGEQEAYCNCEVFPYYGRDVEAEALVSNFLDKRMLKVLSLRVLD